MWHMPTCIFHMLSLMPQNPRHTHARHENSHPERLPDRTGRARIRPRATKSPDLNHSAAVNVELPPAGKGAEGIGQARVRGVSVYCHIGVKINRKTGTSTEESHELDFSRDATGNRGDSSFASREAPLPSLNPYLSREGGAATTAVMSRHSHKDAAET